MMIDRRTFILLSAPFVAATSALAIFPSLLQGALSSHLDIDPLNINRVTFKIDGWDRCDEIARNGSRTLSADPMAGDSISDQVFISINQSWRAAWR